MKQKQQFSVFALLVFGALLLSVQSCKKENPLLPEVTTQEVTEITETSAVGGGYILSDGGSIVTLRGVCWSTEENPTIGDNKTEDGEGEGEFISNITDLTPNTTYYVRAYATNSEGTA